MAVAASRTLFSSSAPTPVGSTDQFQCPASVRRLRRVSRLLPSLLNSVGYRLLLSAIGYFPGSSCSARTKRPAKQTLWTHDQNDNHHDQRVRVRPLRKAVAGA